MMKVWMAKGTHKQTHRERERDSFTHKKPERGSLAQGHETTRTNTQTLAMGCESEKGKSQNRLWMSLTSCLYQVVSTSRPAPSLLLYNAVKSACENLTGTGRHPYLLPSMP